MKKFLVIMAMGVFTVAAQAAKPCVEGNKFFDNWSIGINVGGTSPLLHSAFFPNMRMVGGITLDKQITPVYGLSFEGMGAVNPVLNGLNINHPSHTAFDRLTVMGLNRVNLFNLFGAYKGKPRVFEIEAVAGLGWGHDFACNDAGAVYNTMVTKVGANLNFNAGKLRAWTIAIKPALVYNMLGHTPACFDGRDAAWEVTAGFGYHFKTSSGNHYFSIVKPFDQNEIDRLNATINDLQGQVASKDNTIAAKDQALAQVNDALNKTAKELEECRNRELPEATTINSSDFDVTFAQGSAVVTTRDVAKLAAKLLANPNATVVIDGYASEEGSKALNEKLAQKRADNVKAALVKMGVAADRITAQGQGISTEYTENAWNRRCVCTINE